MVKGITRQVILVKSPDPRLFEEAIFIVKEEALAREGVTAERVLEEDPPGGGRLPEAGPGLEPAAGAAARPPVGRFGGSSRQRRVAGVAVPAVRDLNHF
ncbi:MAG: hypothetical protein V8S34_09100 [Lawsonibacter sp.]